MKVDAERVDRIRAIASQRAYDDCDAFMLEIVELLDDAFPKAVERDTRLKLRGKHKYTGLDVWTAELPLPPTAEGKRRKSRFTFRGSESEARIAFAERIRELSS